MNPPQNLEQKAREIARKFNARHSKHWDTDYLIDEISKALSATLQEARDEALEEAANLCGHLWTGFTGEYVVSVQDEIRALKGKR